VVSLVTGRTLFEINAQKFFQPASNAKLFTAALVLEQLGPDYRIHTDLRSTARPNAQGVIAGDVIVYGRGDPSFGADWQKRSGGEGLSGLVGILTNAGVRRIDGDLVGDDSYFLELAQGAGWLWEDLQYAYGSPLSALSFEGNSRSLQLAPAWVVGAPCQLRLAPDKPALQIINKTTTVETEPAQALSAKRVLGTDQVVITGQMQRGAKEETLAVPMQRPAQVFLDRFRSALAQEGIEVRGQIRVRSQSASGTSPEIPLGTVESPPLREMVGRMLKDSDNLVASLLFAHAGVCLVPGGDRSAEARGVEAMKRFLNRIGVTAVEVQMEEGSGLSRNSLITPHAIVSLLTCMHDRETSAVFKESLSVAGVDGSLQARFRGTNAAGNLRAKTGTLRWAQALSGYVTSKAGEPLAFSIILNRYLPAPGDPDGTEEVDAVARILAELPVRSAPAEAGWTTPSF
jgi:D-alanyl-D-alanine carboxypeptidase/D-alanyl-D-alanine-endopeptidase (penicillin-binding protein 4)